MPYICGEHMAEDKVGIIDHLNIRSSYSESKRLCECLCASYVSEYSINVKIARLAQTFGAGVALKDNRMPMQFARALIEGRDIVLHTGGRSFLNFAYLTDAVVGILTILKKGENGQAYNVCNDKETRSVRECAELMADRISSRRINVKVDVQEKNISYAPDVVMYLDSRKLNNLGWNARVSMIEGYKRLVEYLEETKFEK